MEPVFDFGLFELLALLAAAGVLRRRRDTILRFMPSWITARVGPRLDAWFDSTKGAVDGQSTSCICREKGRHRTRSARARARIGGRQANPAATRCAPGAHANHATSRSGASAGEGNGSFRAPAAGAAD